jgi:hypothetical protein
MHLFTSLLSALALAASTTTASPIAARQYSDQTLQFTSPDPKGVSTWPQGTNQTVVWWVSQEFWSEMDAGQPPPPVPKLPVYGQLFLGLSDIDINTDSEIIIGKLLPNLLCFTVVVTQQYFSFACTCNPLYRRAACS